MKKIASIVLICVFVLSLFAGCKAVDKNKNVVNGTFTEYLVAEKVGTVNRESFMTAEGGLYYKGDNGLYGIISYNGAHDTGAIYTQVNPIGKYFQVRKKEVKGANDIAGINGSLLVDGKGKTVIPQGYAAFYNLNERYIKVAKVTERTYSKDDTLVTRSSNGLCFFHYYNEKSDNYKGVWYVFDTITDKFVPGATGTNSCYVGAEGRFVIFDDDSKKRIKINENGEPLPEGAKIFEDGSYSIEEKVGSMYNSDGKLLFNYDLTGYIPSNMSYGYYCASKYTDGGSKYAVMDKNGKIISSQFDEYINIYGEVVHCGDKVYDLQGNNIIKGTYEGVGYDTMFGQNWMLRNDDYYTVIDKNGDVFFNGPEDKAHSVWTTDFLASKEVDGDHYYYSYKDKDYTIKGYHFAPWIVETSNSNMLYDLIDAMTGKKLLEGYKDYVSISRNSLAYYVYAKYNGGADVYLVVSGAQLEEVINKKNSLFDDLAAEFAKEGINVTVDKETGEIALDSSVLFGGDSAELTGDGKAFLNKFIKAYTTVAFSEKYDGFISKTMVEGHTAPVAGSTYASGLQLSEERALNVKNYCLSAKTGVDVSKIRKSLENVGYSNSKPVYKSGKVDLAASRRVSFRFIVNVEF